MSNNASIVFISWAEDCSRSDSIAKRLGGESYMIYSPRWGSRYLTIVFKYISQSLKTLKFLFRERPRVVFVMAPPIIACAPVWIYCVLTRSRFLIDSHTGALLDQPWKKLIFIHRFFSRRAVATLVTNRYLQSIVEEWGAPTLLVPDVPVVFADPKDWPMQGRVSMTLVSTFTKDEPLEIFVNAARSLPEIDFYVTGDFSGADPEVLKNSPDNVSYTGFLSAEDYVGLLLASDAVISLTIFDHTMQRGAYEAAYLGRPIVTSDFPILRESFDKGTVYVESEEESIVAGIRKMAAGLDGFRAEVEQLRTEKLDRWERVVSEIRGVTNAA